MYEKIIVALATTVVTLGVYIHNLPIRETLAPGGELFIPLYVFIIWACGHTFLKETREAEKGGYSINDDID